MIAFDDVIIGDEHIVVCDGFVHLSLREGYYIKVHKEAGAWSGLRLVMRL